MSALAALTAVALLAPPQRAESDMERRVAILVDDLEDAQLGKAAHIEIIALGQLAAVELSKRALEEWSTYGLIVPRLAASEASARVGLMAAVERWHRLALEADPNPATPATQRQAVALDNARRLAADLAPYVPDAAVLCAPLLEGLPERHRLRVRCGFSPRTPIRKLAVALASESPAAVEVALELLVQHGEAAAGPCERALLNLWSAPDGREGLVRTNDQHEHGVDESTLQAKLSRAVMAVVPRHVPRVDVLRCLLGDRREPFALIEILEQIGDLGPYGANAVPEVARACTATDDAICRAALDTLARLGNAASGELDNVRYRMEHAADPETRRLAQIALRRITRPDDDASRAADLVDDLVHPTRHARARRDLLRLGRPAVQALFQVLGDGERRALWPHAIDLLHELGPAAATEVVALFMTTPADFAHATWFRLQVAVDLAAGTDAQATAAVQLGRWSEDATLAERCNALAARLASLHALPPTAAEVDVIAALTTGSPALVERAARLLRGRAALTPDLSRALVEALARPEPEIASNEDALRLSGDAAGAAACTLLARDPAPPPAAFAIAMARGTAGQCVDLLRRVADLGWPPEVTVAHVRPFLADGRVDEVRIAALEALAKLGAAARPLVADLDRLAAQRFNRAIARAAGRARRACDM